MKKKLKKNKKIIKNFVLYFFQNERPKTNAEKCREYRRRRGRELTEEERVRSAQRRADATPEQKEKANTQSKQRKARKRQREAEDREVREVAASLLDISNSEVE